MSVLGLLLASVMGATLGLLGGGGSILTVPILIYVFGLAIKPAIATSLLVVGGTGLAAMLQHARRGNVWAGAGIRFGSVAMLGSYAGSRLAAFIPGAALLALFTVVMAVSGAAMLRPRGERREPGIRRRPVPHIVLMAQGLVVGTFTGLVGAGGGFVIVPALVLLADLPMRAAVGTSLLVIVMNSLTGFAGYAGHVAVDFELAAIVGAAGVVGSLAGSAAANVLAPERLRRAFGWFVVVMATFMLVEQVPAAGAASWLAPVVGCTAIALLIAAVVRHRARLVRPIPWPGPSHGPW
jgi:uncharacterized protein